MERTVFFVSDRTGITAETLGKSLLTQFGDTRFRKISLRFIDTADKAAVAVERINRAAREKGVLPIVFSTLVDPALRRQVAESECVCFDFMDTFIAPLEKELQIASSHSVGLTHGLGDYNKYQERMEAVNYALSVDDGLLTGRYPEAGVILIGVSRTGKTPTCLYLAMTHGIYAANHPLTGVDLEYGALPETLRPQRDKLFGLTIDPERLHQIRSKRSPGSRYASLKQCNREVEMAEAIFHHEGLPVVNTTSMSIEEIASTVLHLQPRAHD